MAGAAAASGLPTQCASQPPRHSRRSDRREVPARYLRSGNRDIRERPPSQIPSILVEPMVKQHECMNCLDGNIGDGLVAGESCDHQSVRNRAGGVQPFNARRHPHRPRVRRCRVHPENGGGAGMRLLAPTSEGDLDSNKPSYKFTDRKNCIDSAPKMLSVLVTRAAAGDPPNARRRGTG
jgi:hypothetical protein